MFSVENLIEYIEDKSEKIIFMFYDFKLKSETVIGWPSFLSTCKARSYISK